MQLNNENESDSRWDFLQAASVLDMGNVDVITLLQMLVMNQEVLRVSSMHAKQ